jgi:quercetin dioxygenase-like cupin family protein
MNTFPADELENLAALAALDLLDEAELTAFESMAENDAEAQALLSRHRQTAAMLLDAAKPLQPPPILRDRLLARLPGAAQTVRPNEFSLQPGIWIVRSGEQPWEETGIPGIRRKRLHFDAKRQYASNLVSMKAGSVYPKHWHADLEELYMLSGEVRLSGQTLGIGDYCRADPGTFHDPVIATTDCVFIAFASSKDQVVSPMAFGHWLSHKLRRFVLRN